MEIGLQPHWFRDRQRHRGPPPGFENCAVPWRSGRQHQNGRQSLVENCAWQGQSSTVNFGQMGPPPGFQHITKKHRRTINDFEILGCIGQGAYGVVFRAQDRITGRKVAMKRVKWNRLTMGEISALSCCQHPFVINLLEVLFDVNPSTGFAFMVMELAEGGDLKSLVLDKSRAMHEKETRKLMFQLLVGVANLHNKKILHRDLKPENILLTHRADGFYQLKIADFGLCRRYDDPIDFYGHNVVTLWYRAPELLLGREKAECSPAIDIWSVGCIMAELICREVLFPGMIETDQYSKIFNLLGTGFDKLRGERIVSKSLSDDGFDLLTKLLNLDPDRRISAHEALGHRWFDKAFVMEEIYCIMD